MFLISRGREFQRQGAEQQKALRPTVASGGKGWKEKERRRI